MKGEVREEVSASRFGNHCIVANIHYLSFKTFIGFLRLLDPTEVSCMEVPRRYVDFVGPFDQTLGKL